MTDRPLHSTLREMRAQFAAPRTWGALIGVGAVLALIGPFGTSEVMRLVPALVYWSAMAIVGYALGSLVTGLVAGHMPGRAGWQVALVQGGVMALVICPLVIGVNAAVFGFVPRGAALWGFLGSTAAVAAGITWLIGLFMGGQTPPSSRTPVALMRRLPVEKRGALLALVAQDHYVQVHTDRGQEMLLMRLSDAIQEVGDTPGLQVHRAHWVALGAIAAVSRAGDGALLRLHGGQELRAARSAMPALREAGLLP